MATVQQTEGADWKFGLFGCFGDRKLCVLTFLLPCYTLGKNAEGIGEDCLLHGLLTLLGINYGPLIRWRMRQEKNIKGSMLMDGLVYTICPCCALIQDAREIGWDLPEELNNVWPQGQDDGGSGGGGGQEVSRE